jgi:hypothetical protein
MPNRIKFQPAFWFIFILLLSSCAHLDVPEGLPSPAEARTSVYGAWVDLKLFPVSTAQGELLAVTLDTLYYADTKFHAVAIRQIVSARLVRYDPKQDDLALWSVFGVLSTLSHGYYIIFSGPVWLAASYFTYISRLEEPQLNYPETNILRFIPYARFPQGLPENIDRSQLIRLYYSAGEAG